MKNFYLQKVEFSDREMSLAFFPRALLLHPIGAGARDFYGKIVGTTTIFSLNGNF